MIVTLELWLPEALDPYSDRPGAAVLAQQLADFSDTYPDLQVDVVVKKARGRGGILDFMRAARDGAPSVLPDLVILNAVDLETLRGAELIQPLDPIVSTAVINDRFPYANTLGDVDGQTFGFMLGADAQHMAYRPLLFDSPIISWTQVISSPAPFLFPAGGVDRQVNDATTIQYLSAGGRFVDPESEQLTLDRDVTLDVFRFYSDCMSTDVISPSVVVEINDVDQSWERFLAGEGGMTAVRASRYWTEADDTMAAAPLPTRNGQPLTLTRGWAIAMVADDPARQSLAVLLLDWLIAPDHSAQWTQAAGYLPATRKALQFWDVSNAEREMLYNLLESAVPAPEADVMNSVGMALQHGLEALFGGRVSPENAAEVAVESLPEQ
jgi:ABC-type glycerol-3-phosphate transport system substrate-binding protein